MGPVPINTPYHLKWVPFSSEKKTIQRVIDCICKYQMEVKNLLMESKMFRNASSWVFPKRCLHINSSKSMAG